MSTQIKASLEKHLLDWIEANANADSFDWSQYWCAGGLGPRMAEAAYAVFMTSREAQDFAKEQEQ